VYSGYWSSSTACVNRAPSFIEIDGYRFHGDRETFERDRRRDALLSALGYRVLRFSHNLVVDDWVAVEAALLGAMARGDHL
jgi:very-short-patch-repair endonuclease